MPCGFPLTSCWINTYILNNLLGFILQNKVYLESSFHTVDMDNVDLLPDVLLKPDNFELAKEFVNKWNGLKVRIVSYTVEMFRLSS